MIYRETLDVYLRCPGLVLLQVLIRRSQPSAWGEVAWRGTGVFRVGGVGVRWLLFA